MHFVGGKNDVARPGCGLCDGCARRSERSRGCVEFIRKDLVEAQIGDVDSVVVFRWSDPVGVRSGLIFMRAVFALVGQGSGVFAEFAAGKNGKDDDVAAGVVGDEEIFSRAVEGEMTGIFTDGGKLIEQSQLAGFGVNREGADRAVLAVFVGSVEIFSAGMDDYPGGIFSFGGELGSGHFSGGGVERELIDALAFGFVGVGADVSAVGLGGGRNWSFGSRQYHWHKQKNSNRKSGAEIVHGAEKFTPKGLRWFSLEPQNRTLLQFQSRWQASFDFLRSTSMLNFSFKTVIAASRTARAYSLGA